MTLYLDVGNPKRIIFNCSFQHVEKKKQSWSEINPTISIEAHTYITNFFLLFLFCLSLFFFYLVKSCGNFSCVLWIMNKKFFRSSTLVLKWSFKCFWVRFSNFRMTRVNWTCSNNNEYINMEGKYTKTQTQYT